MAQYKCDGCGVEFNRNRARGKSTFCSNACYQKAHGYKSKINTKCGVCDKPISVSERLINASKSGKVFCSRVCFVKHRVATNPKPPTKGTCRVCNETVSNKRIYCDKCRPDLLLADKPLSECIYDGTSTNRYAKVRVHAQRIIGSLVNKKCACCGYSKHVQICHVKSISSFPKETKIKDINSMNNMVLLCPNCHWEFDHKLLSVNDIAKTKEVDPVGFKPTTSRL